GNRLLRGSVEPVESSRLKRKTAAPVQASSTSALRPRSASGSNPPPMPTTHFSLAREPPRLTGPVASATTTFTMGGAPGATSFQLSPALSAAAVPGGGQLQRNLGLAGSVTSSAK